MQNIPNEIIILIDKIKEIMIKNATWNGNIQDLNSEYKPIYIQINSWCIANKVINPNKFGDLWMFYDYWRNENNKLTNYSSRRNYIHSLYQDLLTLGNGLLSVSGLDHIDNTILSHILKYLQSGHNFTAVEEAYKIVREKLIEITGKEKAHEAFSEDNILKIFKGTPKNQSEENFREGVKFLHLAIQNFRNEKVHTKAQELDIVKTIHYLYLASLALLLISD